MPDRSQVYRWQQKSPEFRDALARARADRLPVYIDRLVDLSDRVLIDETLDPTRVRVAADALDRAARLMQPKTVEITGKDGAPLHDPAAVVQALAAYMRERESRAEIRATAEDLPVIDDKSGT